MQISISGACQAAPEHANHPTPAKRQGNACCLVDCTVVSLRSVSCGVSPIHICRTDPSTGTSPHGIQHCMRCLISHLVLLQVTVQVPAGAQLQNGGKRVVVHLNQVQAGHHAGVPAQAAGNGVDRPPRRDAVTGRSRGGFVVCSQAAAGGVFWVCPSKVLAWPPCGAACTDDSIVVVTCSCVAA